MVMPRSEMSVILKLLKFLKKLKFPCETKQRILIPRGDNMHQSFEVISTSKIKKILVSVLNVPW